MPPNIRALVAFRVEGRAVLGLLVVWNTFQKHAGTAATELAATADAGPATATTDAATTRPGMAATAGNTAATADTVKWTDRVQQRIDGAGNRGRFGKDEEDSESTHFAGDAEFSRQRNRSTV